MCRDLIQGEVTKGARALDLYEELLLPAVESVGELFRKDRINTAVEHVATRISRSLASQLQQALLPLKPNGKRVLITCDNEESEEVAAQICADLFEARGWDVCLLGGGVPNDEILSLVGSLKPDILLILGIVPAELTRIRALIDHVRSVGASPTMNIMVSGGVFNRVGGLWREISADMHAHSIKEAISIADASEPRKPETVARSVPRKRRRRRRPPLLGQPGDAEGDLAVTRSTTVNRKQPEERLTREKAENPRIPIRLSEMFDDLAELQHSNPLQDAEKRELLDTVMQQLTRTEQLILTLYYIEEMTMSEIGQVLDMSESYISQLHKAILSRLRSQVWSKERGMD